MPRFDGSLALKLDFNATPRMPVPARRRLELAPEGSPRNEDKYKALEHRRRQAQIRARRQLELLEGE